MAQVRVSLPESLHRPLRVLRVETRRKLDDLIAEAVGHLLRAYDHDHPAEAGKPSSSADSAEK